MMDFGFKYKTEKGFYLKNIRDIDSSMSSVGFYYSDNVTGVEEYDDYLCDNLIDDNYGILSDGELLIGPGKKDRYGEKIFVGDIVRYDGALYRLMWDYNDCRFYLDCIRIKDLNTKNVVYFKDISDDDIEIVKELNNGVSEV